MSDKQDNQSTVEVTGRLHNVHGSNWKITCQDISMYKGFDVSTGDHCRLDHAYRCNLRRL